MTDLVKPYSKRPWIKWYTDDSEGWLMLTLAERGLAEGLARKATEDGYVRLRQGLQGLAVLLHAPLPDVSLALDGLVAKGRVRWTDDKQALFVIGHRERQTAVTCDAERARQYRLRHAPSRAVTDRHDGVTQRDASRTSRSDQIRSEEIRSEERRDVPPQVSHMTPQPIPETLTLALREGFAALAQARCSLLYDENADRLWDLYRSSRLGAGRVVVDVGRDWHAWLIRWHEQELRGKRGRAPADPTLGRVPEWKGQPWEHEAKAPPPPNLLEVLESVSPRDTMGPARALARALPTAPQLMTEEEYVAERTRQLDALERLAGSG